jgi:pimeloyl-[acyl-carrier protein] methyl ester esterase
MTHLRPYLPLWLAALLLLCYWQARADESTFLSDRLSVEVLGAGPDVILIPGLASSRDVWRPLATGLAARYRVHLVQLAGFAGEPWFHADEPFLQPAVDELDRYIVQAKLQQPAIIGHSLGGLAALLLAQAHPEAVGRVMTVDTLPFYSALFYPWITADQARPVAERAAAEVLGLDDATYHDRQVVVAQGLTRDPGMQQQIVQWSMASDRHAVATALREIMLTDAREGLAGMTTPVTAVYADAGRPADQVDELWSQGYRGLPGVKRVRVAGSLHFIMSDQPAAFARLVDGFLAQPAAAQ